MSLAQDVIVKQDGSTILSKVMEINNKEIKYKKWSNMEGPIYAISRSEVLSINYQNGEVEFYSMIIKDESDDVVNSFHGIMEYKRRPSRLTINSRNLTDEEIMTFLGKKGYDEYLSAKHKLQTGDIFGTIGFVLFIPAVGGWVYGIMENNYYAYAIGLISDAIALPCIIVDIVFSNIGRNGMMDLVKNYNSNNGRSVSLQVFPSIIKQQFGESVGVTLSLNF